MNNPMQPRNRIYGIHRRVAVTALVFAIVLVPALVATRSAQAQTYTYSVLYSFTGAPDGANPYGDLVWDAKGNLYGTTNGGGNLYGVTLYGGSGSGFAGYGTVYKVDKKGKESVLYTFTGVGDGAYPTASLVQNAQGHLYGATQSGGASGYGTVFKLTP